MDGSKNHETVGTYLKGALELIDRQTNGKHPALAYIEKAMELCADEGEPDDTMMLYDDLEESFVGIGSRCGFPDVAVYNGNKVIEGYRSQGMSMEEVVEYLNFNVLGGYIGPATPIILLPMSFEQFSAHLDEEGSGIVL